MSETVQTHEDGERCTELSSRSAECVQSLGASWPSDAVPPGSDEECGGSVKM